MLYKAFKIDRENDGSTEEEVVENFIKRYNYDPDVVLTHNELNKGLKRKRESIRNLIKQQKEEKE